jgi:hypothetical protein
LGAVSDLKMKTLVPLVALTIGAGSLKAELPGDRAADLNAVARMSFLGLSGVFFLGSAWIIAGGICELAYARRFGKEGDENRGPFPGDVGVRLEDDTGDAPLTPELERDCKLYLTPLQRSERTKGPVQGFNAASNNLAKSALPIRAAQDRRKWRRDRQSDSLSSSSAGRDWDPAI